MGRVRPRVRKPEGPFGDHYGYYSLRHDYPVFEVDRLARRRDAIYPATVVGKPRQEDFFIGDLLQTLLSPLFPLVMPAVRQLWSYGETGYHSLAAAVVRERYRREAMASAFRILGEGQLSLTKFLLVTDRDVDLSDFKATLTHVLARTRPETDLYVFGNLSMDTLDYTGPQVNEGSKGVWLGLGDPVRDLPEAFSAAEVPPGVRDVRVFCPGCLVVEAPPHAEEPDAAARLATAPAFAAWPLVVLTDDAARATRSAMNFLWTTFTRFEPAADIHAAATRVVRNHVARTPPIVIDARMKPWYPKELTLRSGGRGHGVAPLARVLPVRRRDGRQREGAPGLSVAVHATRPRHRHLSGSRRAVRTWSERIARRQSQAASISSTRPTATCHQMTAPVHAVPATNASWRFSVRPLTPAPRKSAATTVALHASGTGRRIGFDSHMITLRSCGRRAPRSPPCRCRRDAACRCR